MDLTRRALLGLLRIAEDKAVPHESRISTFRTVLSALGSIQEVPVETARLLLAVPLRWSEFTVQEMVPNPCGHDFDPGARYCNICGKNVDPVAKDVLREPARNWVGLPEVLTEIPTGLAHEIAISDRYTPGYPRLRPLFPIKDGFEWCLGVEMTSLRKGTRSFTNFTIPVVFKNLEEAVSALGVNRKAELVLVME